MMNNRPKKRIYVIDALRGFALMGILLVHFLEHFDATGFRGESSPIMQWLDVAVSDVIRFLFLGKSYAIFSMLFGLSFFIQMENNKERGVDFRLRFIWRLALLYMLGHLNGLFYSGEILVIYALFGLILIPLYKLPVTYLFPLCLIFLFLIPNIIYMIWLSFHPGATDIFSFLYTGGYVERIPILTDGTFGEVMLHNMWKGQVTKWMWYLQPENVFRIWGLFMAGLLIGKLGIYRDVQAMIIYAKRALGWGVVLFIIFFSLNKIVPLSGIDNKMVSYLAGTISHLYANLGLMFIIIGLFVLFYFRLDGKPILDKLAPVGRMSLTNYMMQSLIGALLFYGFGLGLASSCGPAITTCMAMVFIIFQIWFSNRWMKYYYYGPVEWIWRLLTWLPSGRVGFKRRESVK